MVHVFDNILAPCVGDCRTCPCEDNLLCKPKNNKFICVRKWSNLFFIKRKYYIWWLVHFQSVWLYHMVHVFDNILAPCVGDCRTCPCEDNLLCRPKNDKFICVRKWL